MELKRHTWHTSIAEHFRHSPLAIRHHVVPSLISPNRSYYAPADVGELDGTLHHATGGVTVVRQDASRKRSMVGADAHRPAQLLALEHERLEALFDGYEVLVEVFL